jgi:hypothetical protein
MATAITPNARPEALPQALADELSQMMRSTSQDGDVSRILADARQAMAALSWARWKIRQDKLTRAHQAQRMMARHVAHRTGGCHA